MDISEPTKNLPTVLADKLSSHLTCPICGRLYSEPVISIKCGHTFCKKCAFSASNCPVDGNQCDTTQLVVNRLVVGQIEDLLIFCQYGVMKQNGDFVSDPSGCQEKIQIGKRSEHESQCSFAPLPCPNSEVHCGRFRKSELESHTEVCPYLPCSHGIKGCEFTGTKDQISEHLNHCGYRGLQNSVSIKDFNLQTRLLEENNKELRDHVNVLENKVVLLEGSKTSIQTQLETCVREITSLQSKYDNLQSTLDQLMSGRNRRSITSPGNTGDYSLRSRSNSSSNLRYERPSSFGGTKRSPSSSIREEHWQMPFVFKCIGTLKGHKDIVWCLATKRYKVFSSGSDSTIKVWDMENLAKGCIKTMEGHTGTVHSMAVHEDSLYSAGDDRSIRVWNAKTFEEEKCVENAHDNIISAMIVAGEYLFTSTFSLIKVWEIRSLTFKTVISGLHHWVRALALSMSKDSLFSGSHNTIDIWNTVEPFNLKGKIDHTFGSVYSITVTPKYVVAGTYNQSIQLFCCDSYQHMQTLSGHIGTIHSLITSLSGRFLFSASVDKSIQVWDLENMLPIQTLQRHDGSVNTVIVVGDFMLSGSEDKEIKVYRYFQMQMGFALQGVT
ncbi:E3 ubiquitin-protein ligase TRAF7-like isoform X3 [Mytilus trossulus]|uniref:E3 ubiquitin-protein ligase TRAF7-like isoform X3 n=1 Tax=Mytilus trossulus TaxID=6551 RepID=UPI00300433DB